MNVPSQILRCAAVFCDHLWCVQEEVMSLTIEDSDDEEENSSDEEQEETDMESDLEGKRDDGKSWLLVDL